MQTEETLIRQLLQELPDLGLTCLQRFLWGKALKKFLYDLTKAFINLHINAVIVSQ